MNVAHLSSTSSYPPPSSGRRGVLLTFTPREAPKARISKAPFNAYRSEWLRLHRELRLLSGRIVRLVRRVAGLAPNEVLSARGLATHVLTHQSHTTAWDDSELDRQLWAACGQSTRDFRRLEESPEAWACVAGYIGLRWIELIGLCRLAPWMLVGGYSAVHAFGPLPPRDASGWQCVPMAAARAFDWFVVGLVAHALMGEHRAWASSALEVQ